MTERTGRIRCSILRIVCGARGARKRCRPATAGESKECKEEGENNRDKGCSGEIQNRPHGEEGEQRGCLYDSAIDTHDIPGAIFSLAFALAGSICTGRARRSWCVIRAVRLSGTPAPRNLYRPAYAAGNDYIRSANVRHVFKMCRSASHMGIACCSS